MKNWFRSNRQHLLIISIFIALCFLYFSPAIQGKVLYQSDIMEAKAQSREIMEVKAATGHGPLWTNSMYGGMPAFQIWAKYPGNMLTYVIGFIKTVFPDPIDTILSFLLGSYFLLNVLKMKPWIAAAGAVAFSFSSYNFIYILAGHSNHAMAMAVFAPILGSILLTLRGGKYLLRGAVLTAFFLALEIRTNHIQMTYYLFMILILFIIIEGYHAISSKQSKPFFTALAYLSAASALALTINAGSLWSTWEYGQESIRGKANLTRSNTEANSGLQRGYAYQYSQGVGEIATFLVPNLYGGASSDRFPEGKSQVEDNLLKAGVPEAQTQGLLAQLDQQGILRPYWGDKPSTAGSWYFGAIVMFLFALGLFIIKTRFKWWILSASFLFIFLSFGKNFPLVSDLFFDHFPMYNKFRSVDFALAVPAFLIPLLAFLALNELITQKDIRKDLSKRLMQSFYITAGFLMIILIFPTLIFDFKASYHAEVMVQIAKTYDISISNLISNGLVADRISLARTDALRSLIFILIAFAVIWFMIKSKIKTETAVLIIGVAILMDMWGVDRRYLNNTNFYDKDQLAQSFQPSKADQQIMADPALDYRVLDLSKSDPFFDAAPSYFHKSVGGRHSARLRRYDELITAQFNGKLNEPVLDMLNTKYFIVPDSVAGQLKPVLRTSALGNAWFVHNVKYVEGADAEMNAITSFHPKDTAIVQNDFAALVGKLPLNADTTASIELLKYHPDNLLYKYKNSENAVAVFAEIWYDKGWNAYLDGIKVPYFRANYILRALKLPAGEHEIAFKFEPKSYLIGDKISLFASLALVITGVFAFYKRRKQIVK
ncbi:YfhO family protein [Pedobacter sp. JCM 36344]|uniref:YfhO family protein n=1 Tax=Pedobacter sp. JCM 36344 TaxID=3374280 RepID=UPI00397A4319